MKIGDKVKTTQRIREDDWYEGVEWDGDDEPYQIEEGTEGTVTEVDKPYDGFCSVTFGELKGVLVSYKSDFEPFIEVVLINDNMSIPSPNILQSDSQYGLSDDERLTEYHEQQRRNRRFDEAPEDYDE